MIRKREIESSPKHALEFTNTNYFLLVNCSFAGSESVSKLKSHTRPIEIHASKFTSPRSHVFLVKAIAPKRRVDRSIQSLESNRNYALSNCYPPVFRFGVGLDDDRSKLIIINPCKLIAVDGEIMEIRAVGDVSIAVFVKRLDAYTSKDAEAMLKDIVEKGARKVVCDLSQTEYIASAGLRLVLAISKNLQKLGGQLVLCCLKPYVKEVFDTAGFTQIFKIYNSIEDALKSVQ